MLKLIWYTYLWYTHLSSYYSPTIFSVNSTRVHKGDQQEILTDEKHDQSLLLSPNSEVRSLSPTPLEHSPLTLHSPQRPNPLPHSTFLSHAQEVQCPVCGQVFQSSDMNIHIEKMHSYEPLPSDVLSVKIHSTTLILLVTLKTSTLIASMMSFAPFVVIQLSLTTLNVILKISMSLYQYFCVTVPSLPLCTMVRTSLDWSIRGK